MILRTRTRDLTFPRRPLLMGILNLNDDSFCDDGTLDPDVACAQARRMAQEGADIIDIGAESARTNRAAISIAEECRRLHLFLDQWAALRTQLSSEHPSHPAQVWPPLLSINTWRPEVIAAVLPHGGDLINDLSALPDAQNAALCAAHGAALLIMHSAGEPKQKHTHVRYDDIMATLDNFFAEKIALATRAGLSRDAIVLDPGIDFAKTGDDNLRILRDGATRLGHFHRPVLMPISRKSILGQTLGLKNPRDRDAATMAALALGVRDGVHLFRVHHVAAAADALATLWAVHTA
jgi:dihydropteroate synthase